MQDVSTTGAAAPAGQALYRRVIWRVIPVLFAGLIVAYIDRLNVSFAKLQMQDDLGLSDAVYGAGAGIFFIGYILCEVPSNMLLYRVGARRWLARIMITWGLVSAAMMFVTGPTSFYVLRFLLGMMEAGFIPGVLLYLTYWFPAAERGRANALFLVGSALAGVVGGPLAAMIMGPLGGVAGLAGWQWLFLVEGLMAVVLAGVLLVALDDGPQQASWLTEPERARILADLAAERRESRGHSFLDALRNPRIAYLAGLYFLIVLGFGGVTFWMPQLIENSGVDSTAAIGWLSAVPWLVGAVAMVVVSRSSDRTGERKWHMVATTVTSGVGYLITVAFADSTVLALVGLTLATVGILATFPLFLGLPARFLTGMAAASGIALVHCLGNVGSAVSPYFIGYVTDATGAPSRALLVIAAGMVLTGLLLAAFLPRQLARD